MNDKLSLTGDQVDQSNFETQSDNPQKPTNDLGQGVKRCADELETSSANPAIERKDHKSVKFQKLEEGEILSDGAHDGKTDKAQACTQPEQKTENADHQPPVPSVNNQSDLVENTVTQTPPVVSVPENSKSNYLGVKRVPVKQWRSSNVEIYDFDDMIGKGTFGKVFKAKLKLKNGNESQEVVSLKKLIMSREEEGFPITALREIEILKKLNHEHVVQLKDIAVRMRKLTHIMEFYLFIL